MSTVRTFNVEAEFPTLEEARKQVIEEIRRAKREQVCVLQGQASTTRKPRFESVSDG